MKGSDEGEQGASGNNEDKSDTSTEITGGGNPEEASAPIAIPDEPAEETQEYSDKEVRNIALAVIAGVLFGGIATGVAFPTLPLLGELLGISAIMLGIILSANRIARLVINTPAGQIVDKLGARKPMIIGLFIQAFAPFGYVVGLHTSPDTFTVLPLIGEVSYAGLVFVFARCFWGIGSAFVMIGGFVIITKVTVRSNRGKWMGYMGGIRSLGFPSGLVFGGILNDVFDAQTAFLTAGFLALLAAFVAYHVIPQITSSTGKTTRLRDIPVIIQEDPRVLPLSLGNFTIQFLFGGVILTTVVMYASEFKLSFSLLEAAGIGGAVMGIAILTSGATTFVSGRISDKLSNRIILTIPGFALISIGFVLLAYNPTLLGILGSVMVMGVGVGSCGPTLMAFLGDIAKEDELGKTAGVYNVIGDIGLSLGPLLAVPMVAEWFGFTYTYLFCAALTIVVLVLVNATLLTK